MWVGHGELNRSKPAYCDAVVDEYAVSGDRGGIEGFLSPVSQAGGVFPRAPGADLHDRLGDTAVECEGQ